MWIMVVYVFIVFVCESIVIAIGLALDRLYPPASLPISLSLFLLSSGWVGFCPFD
jgi:hypothetical protein